MCAVQHACIYTEEEVVVTEGKQKDRTHVNTKTNMSALRERYLSMSQSSGDVRSNMRLFQSTGWCEEAVNLTK